MIFSLWIALAVEIAFVLVSFMHWDPAWKTRKLLSSLRRQWESCTVISVIFHQNRMDRMIISYMFTEQTPILYWGLFSKHYLAYLKN